MFILNIWERRETFFNPSIYGNFATRRTESGFTSMRDNFRITAIWTKVVMKAQRSRFAFKDFINIKVNIISNKMLKFV